jgi:hypothetical protein
VYICTKHCAKQIYTRLGATAGNTLHNEFNPGATRHEAAIGFYKLKYALRHSA